MSQTDSSPIPPLTNADAVKWVKLIISIVLCYVILEFMDRRLNGSQHPMRIYRPHVTLPYFPPTMGFPLRMTLPHSVLDPHAEPWPYAVVHPRAVSTPYTRLVPFECPAPPPSPRQKRIYKPPEPHKEFSGELKKLLNWELHELLAVGVNEVPNPTLNPVVSYLFNREKAIGWDAPTRASQVKKRMLSDPRFMGAPEENWGKTTVWDRRDRHPVDGFEIDKDEYYLGVGGYYETWQTWQEDRRGYWMARLLEGNKRKKRGKSILRTTWTWLKNVRWVEHSATGLREIWWQTAWWSQRLVHGLEEAYGRFTRLIDDLVLVLGKAWWQSTRWIDGVVLQRFKEASGQCNGEGAEMTARGHQENSEHNRVIEEVRQPGRTVEEEPRVHVLGEAVLEGFSP